MLSDAVDRSVAAIDFRALSGQTVYLDTQYLEFVKGLGFVNADYVISSLRQQMVAARCLLQDKPEDAEYIVEARIGTLGADRHEVTYGVPANNLLSTAATLMPVAPPVPTIPEISIAKRNDQQAAAKIGVFAYNRGTRQPVWQSGLSLSRSNARDAWVAGAGPFQSGSIHKGTKFAGRTLGFSFLGGDSEAEEREPLVAYEKEMLFIQPPTPASPPAGGSEIQQAVAEKSDDSPEAVESAANE